MSSRNRKANARSAWLVVLMLGGPLLFGRCSLVMGDLPEPVSSSGSSGNTGTNQADGAGGTTGVAGNGGQSTAGTNATVAGGASSSGGVGGSSSVTPEAGTSGGGNAGTSAGGSTSSSAGAGGSCDPCDCDGDGAPSPDCNEGGAANADCDDTDPDAKPAQEGWFTESNPNLELGFDYDCSTMLEREFPTAVSCSALALGSCVVPDGFLSPLPACGDTGDWGSCKSNGLSCVPDKKGTKVMGCH